MLALHQRLTRLFDEKSLSWLLEHALDRPSIVRLCNICKVTYAGMRTKSMPVDRLASDLARQTLDDERIGEQVLKTLTRVCPQEIADVERMAPSELPALTESYGYDSPRHLSRLIVGLMVDDREEMRACIAGLIEEAERNRPVAEPAALSDQEPSPGENQTVSSDTDSIQAARAELNRLAQQYRTMESRIEDMKEQMRQMQIERDTLRQHNRTLEKNLAEKERDAQRLQGELDGMPALAGQINQLERENRKLRYQMEKRSSGENVSVDLNPLVNTFDRKTEDIKEKVQDTARHLQEDYHGLRRAVEELQKEVRSWRVESQKDQKNSPAKRPARREHERVGVFVDVQNMFYAARQHDARLDFEKLLHAAVGERRLIRAVAYVIQTPEVDQSGFVAMLQQRNYQVQRKDLRLRSDGSAKGDWDMGMAIDMIGMADKLDVMALVSGDGDFVSLIHLLKEMGPRIEVFSFPHNTARDLIEAADQYYVIDDSMLIKMRPELSDAESTGH